MSHDNDSKTCFECGLDRSRAPEQLVARVQKQVHETEDEASRLRCRVEELEQVIRAFVKGNVPVAILREVAEAPA